MCGKFSLKPHIDGSTPPATTDPLWPQWDQADSCVGIWMFGSVDDAVLDLTMESGEQTARELWVAIEGLFRATRSHARSSSTTSSIPCSKVTLPLLTIASV